MQNDAKRFKIFRRITALSIEQENAITLLLTGASDQTVATHLKLGRATVNRWRLYHPLFVSELNRRRAFQRSSGMDGIRSLVPGAVDTLRDRIVNGDGRLALAFLHRSGIFGTRDTGPMIYADTGPTDLQSVIDEEVRRRRAGGHLPMPAVPHASSTVVTNGSVNGAATSDQSALEPPITDEEREAVLADLLDEASSDAPFGLPLDIPVTTPAAVAPEPGIHRSFENK